MGKITTISDGEVGSSVRAKLNTAMASVEVDGSTITGDGNVGTPLQADPAAIDHDSLLNFSANEHIDWTSTNQNLSTTGTASAASGTFTGDVTVFGGTGKELELGDEVLENSSTGVTSGGTLSVGTPSTTYDVALGTGHIVDVGVSTYTSVSWGNIVGTTPAANGVRYVYINSGGTITETGTAPTAENRRDNIYLGRVIVSSGTVIQAQNEQVILEQTSNQIYDLAKGLRIFNEYGNTISANGANLSFDKSSGTVFSIGANFSTNTKIPHSVSIPVASPVTFQKITQTAATGTNVTVIDPTNYDVSGTITSISGSNNQAQNMRVYLFPSGNVRVAYGQVVYSTLTNAIQGLSSEAYTENPSILGNGVLIGIITVTKGCTDLSDTSTARFLHTSRFGETAVGGSGTSVSSLQNAYENSVQPEITTNTTGGSFDIRRGSAVDSDNVFTVQNGAGTTTFSIRGNGTVNAAQSFVSENNITARGDLASAPTAANSDAQIALVPTGTGASYFSYGSFLMFSNGIKFESTGDVTISKQLGVGTGSELTISTGAITITESWHSVDTEANAASDDLDTISGGVTGSRLVLTAADSTRTVVLKDGTGNLKLNSDFSLDNVEDTIELLYNGTNWLEISRSDNGV